MHSDGDAIEVVQFWHEALNRGDFDRLVALMHVDVEFAGPRGAGRGAEVVRDWAARSSIHLEPQIWFQRAGDVVVIQRAHWRSPDSGERGPPEIIASVFEVRDHLIARIARYDAVQGTLATGIDRTEAGRPAAAPDSSGTAQGVTIRPQVLRTADLPYGESSLELEGYLHAQAPLSLIFFDGPPCSGPKLHRHPYMEVFVVHEGDATFTVGDDTIEVSGGQIVIAPAGVPHAFVNSGDGPLRQTDIHASDRFITEWLEGE